MHSGRAAGVTAKGSYTQPGTGRGRPRAEAKDAARAENPNCVFCDRPTTQEPGPTQSNIDHAKAKSRGGNNTEVDAVQPQCSTCSARQGAEMTRYSREMKKQLPPQPPQQ